ncbi:MAG: ferredoxin family protein [Candidatus Bathyarchaeia archaeon]
MQNKASPAVTVDWNRCSGIGNCVDACPVNVFELQELAEYPETYKSVPVNVDACIFCMKCVTVCEEQAIVVNKPKDL